MNVNLPTKLGVRNVLKISSLHPRAPGSRANSTERGLEPDCLKETKRRRAILKPVGRPPREPPSRFDRSRQTRPRPSATPPTPHGARRSPDCSMQLGRALGSRPSPAGRSCFLFSSKRFVPGHKFAGPVGQARMYALVNTAVKNTLPGYKRRP